MRRHLGGERHRIGPVGHRPVDAVHPELVEAIGREAGPEQFPDPGGSEHPHRGVGAVPAVELTDQADALGIRRPHRERHPVDHAVGGGEGPRVCAQDLPQPFVAALVEQVQVHLAQGGQKPVAVGGDVRGARIADLQAVVDEVGEGQRDGEQAGADMLHRMALSADKSSHRLGVRAQGPDDGLIPVFVRAEDRMRVVMRPGNQAGQVIGVGCQVLLDRHATVIPGAAVRPAGRAGSSAC